MPVQYEGVREEHLAVRTHAGMFDVSHMGEVEVEGPGALAFLQRALSNDVAKIEIGGAQYSCLCAEDGGVLDDLFAYRLGGDRYLIVTNAANHDADLAWLGRWSRDFDVSVRDVADRYAMLAVQGPHARGIVAGRAGRRPAAADARRARSRVGGRPALVCGTGYTGEDGVELLIDPEVAPPIWAELLDAGVVPCGLGARDTLRLEVCFHLHGNDLTPRRNPIEAGLGWCCAEATGFVGSDAVARARAEGPAEKLAPFKIEGRRHPAPRQPGARRRRRGRRRHLRHLLALAGDRDRDGLRPRRPGRARDRGRDRRARQATAGPNSFQAPLREEGEVTLSEANYPDELIYHDQHDWARLEGDEHAVFGITWYAQDSLGEVVFYDPPEVGAAIHKDASYAEVESVKAVSDVIAPLSGEIVEVNEALADAPEKINEDPYGEGWLVKVRLTAPGEAEGLLSPAEYRKLVENG